MRSTRFWPGLVVVCSIWILFFTSLAHASLGARPAYLYVDLDKRNPSGTFTVTNLSNEAQTYRAKATHFEVSENGSIYPVEADEYSLAKWIKFNPKEFTLPPKSSRKVRFTILSRNKKVEPREYWGAIQFLPLKGLKYSQKGEAGQDVSFQVVTSLLIPIYGKTSGITYDAVVDTLEVKQDEQKIYMDALIKNTGEGGLRLKGDWEVLANDSGEVVATSSVDPIVVFPKQNRRLKVTFDQAVPPGTYTARIRLNQKKPQYIFSGKKEFDAH